jgi:HEAT repeat protein
LGQIAKPLCIEALYKILVPKRFFFFRKRLNGRLRAAAAFALGQIPHTKAVEYLGQLVEDRDIQIREIARNVLESARLSSS